MKKARARSTTCTEAGRRGLALAAVALVAAGGAAVPARAQLPEDACFSVVYDPADLAARPGRGVRGLWLEFQRLVDWDRQAKGPYRHLRLTVRMGGQGQALRDGAAGATLTATAECRTGQALTGQAPTGQGRCWAPGDAGHFDLRLFDARTLELRTRDFPVADYGGSMTQSNLAETPDRETVYLLTRADRAECGAD